MPTEKVACLACGGKILPITFQLNEGKCAPCADLASGGRKFFDWRTYANEDMSDPAQLEQFDKHGLGALHWAIQSNELILFRNFLQAGAPINQLTSHCSLTPLHYAAEEIRPCFLELLIRHGASTEENDWENRVPLHLVAANGLIGHAKKLVQAGCRLRPMDRYKRSPLDDAFRNGHLGMIEYLAQLPEARHRRWSDRLPLAVEYGHADVVEWLLRHGANPNTNKRPAWAKAD